MSLLNETGVLGYITVNTFFKSVNARTLREYMSDNSFSLKVIDFGEQLVFKKKTGIHMSGFFVEEQMFIY